MENNALTRLQQWYQSKCNGTWEHRHGLTIATLDNPGWEVHLSGENNRKAMEIAAENSVKDWMCIKADKTEFHGYGGADNLHTILEYAVLWMHSQSE